MQGPVNVSAAVGAVNEDPPESPVIDSEAVAPEREQAARKATAPPESSAEYGVTESNVDLPRSGVTSPDSLGSGPPD